MHKALSALQVADTQAAEFLAADAVIEQGGDYGTVAYTLQRVRAGASSKRLACASPRAGVLPSLLLAIGLFTPSTGFPATALRSQLPGVGQIELSTSESRELEKIERRLARATAVLAEKYGN
jgi:hypothetical protein